ncbi:MAG: glycosyltransferase [Desulfobulbaceae bacterium]|nr:glycosyltransferase [Desulfobulbaceae bacterium]
MISIWGFIIDIEHLIFGVFAFFALIQFFYFGFFFLRFAFYNSEKKSHKKVSNAVSVVICAKNEHDNLEKLLPLILNQDYPDFEVIVVNDFSDDDSVFLLRNFEKKYSHLKVITLRENVNFFSGKKLALAVGIKSAKNDVILLTDADCKVVGKNWIKLMQRHFDNGTDIVLGYSGYNKYPGFLNALIRFDTLSIAMQYFSYALTGYAYMGVGRNLAYRKRLFIEAKGFTSHYKINSGDDDLFINQTAKKRNTCIELSKESFSYSEPKKTFSSWFYQKKRHLSTAKYYKFSHKFRLGLYSLSQYLFFAAFITTMFFLTPGKLMLIAGSVFLLRWVVLLLLYYNACKKFNERKLFIFSPLFEVIFLLLNPIFLISNWFVKKNRWK